MMVIAVVRGLVGGVRAKCNVMHFESSYKELNRIEDV